MFLIKKSLILLLVYSIFIPFIAFQDPKTREEITRSFETGNSKVLASYFNQNVEMAIPGNKNIYSKAQAQQILVKFFSENRSESFKILTSTPENEIENDAQNIIGLLKTKNATFRVYILFKKNDGKDYIHLLKIEKRQN